MRRFLIVEDDEVLRDLHGFFINTRYKGVEIDHASNGKEALAKTLVYNYSVILSDIDMPVMDGITFHKILKGDSPLMAKKVVFISGGLDRHYLSYLKEEGCPFLDKPFARKDFYRLIDSVLDMEDRRAANERGHCHVRKFIRIKTRQRCNLVPVTPGSDSFEFITAETMDHSEGGLGLKYEGEELPPGSRFKVYVENLNIFQRVARVVWSQSIGGHSFRLGLQWV